MPGCFLSDNSAGVSPEIMDAIAGANSGMAAGYGADPLTESLKARFADFFEREAEVFVVATGTAANALSLAACCPPWGAVLCHEQAHVTVDECGAPEFYTAGAKLCPVAAPHGRLTVEALDATFTSFRLNDPHQTQPGAVSLSQATEAGTVYPMDAVREIAAWTHERGMKLHMDGARFANALVSLGCTPADATWRAGVDILSFGATKNGALAAEAIIVFEPSLARSMAYRRKRGGQLLSKSRFFSAQLHAYLDGDLWRRNATRANGAATALSRGLSGLPGVEIVHPVEANEVFVRMPEAMADGLRLQGFQFLDWPKAGRGGRRLVASANATDDEVRGFVAAAKDLAGQ
ncbi:MAG: low specificity L-threonine aldolase [Alphaproteobacteria bacterium]|nr:low specificity L-threonine aldolase [Alphaproteobacteria bacterium]